LRKKMISIDGSTSAGPADHPGKSGDAQEKLNTDGNCSPHWAHLGKDGKRFIVDEKGGGRKIAILLGNTVPSHEKNMPIRNPRSIYRNILKGETCSRRSLSFQRRGRKREPLWNRKNLAERSANPTQRRPGTYTDKPIGKKKRKWAKTKSNEQDQRLLKKP